MARKLIDQAAETFAQFREELDTLKGQFPRFEEDDIFVLWFLRAYLSESGEETAKAITGGTKDKGVDAILIDDAARAVFVVQGKYRDKLGQKAEARQEVFAFANLSLVLHAWDEQDVEAFLSDADPGVAHRLRLARKKIHGEKYNSWLYFVTTGNVSATVQKDAQQILRNAASSCRIEFLDAKRVMTLYTDYLTDVPTIPEVDLEVEAGGCIAVNTVAHRADSQEGIDSWVFSMRGDVLASLYEKHGRRLFARNIRGYLGIKQKDLPVNRATGRAKRGARSVNAGMVATLKSEPHRFFYYNNGVTVICDTAEQITSQGKTILRLGNPQIVNGQQTTRTLAHYAQPAGMASVLVKVIRVPRDIVGGFDAFEEIVSRIVAGANWQNAIRPSDLMSNDRRQVDLERSLRRRGYYYVRKRQTKGEIKQLIGNGQFHVVTKEEMAQASAGCNLDPHTIRSGLEKLFMEDRYTQVFPNSDPDYYLPRYWLMREVSWSSRGFPERGYAKWLVLNFLWSHVSPLVKGRPKCRAFCLQCERQTGDLIYPLSDAVDIAFKRAQKFYLSNCGSGPRKVDVSTFFKNKKNLHLEFAKHWDSAAKTNKDRIEKQLTKIRSAIELFEE